MRCHLRSDHPSASAAGSQPEDYGGGGDLGTLDYGDLGGGTGGFTDANGATGGAPADYYNNNSYGGGSPSVMDYGGGSFDAGYFATGGQFTNDIISARCFEPHFTA